MDRKGLISICKDRLRYADKTYWLLFGALIIVSIIALFSASSSLAFKQDNALEPVMQHILFLVVGAALAFVIQLLPIRLVRACAYIGLFISFILLLLTFTSLGVEINDAKRWLRIGGLTIQPSELAKLTLIIVASDLLSRIKTKPDEKNRSEMKIFFATLIITAMICLPIFPSNLSTTLLLGGVIFLLFILAGVHIKYWGTTLLVALMLLTVGYFVVEYQYVRPQKEVKGMMKRVVTWVGRVDDLILELKTPQESFELNDDNYQRTLSKIAIARGSKSPVGVLPGNSQMRDRLPLAYADYIFAIIVEETGVVGAIGLIFIYLAILFRACVTSSRYADYAAMLMVMGLALMICCQALVSMMVVVGIGPVTGQPLPLISRGGTSVLITCIYFGVILCVAREQNELHARRQLSVENSRQTVPDIQLD